jgi:hypothetical protein
MSFMDDLDHYLNLKMAEPCSRNYFDDTLSRRWENSMGGRFEDDLKEAREKLEGHFAALGAEV